MEINHRDSKTQFKVVAYCDIMLSVVPWEGVSRSHSSHLGGELLPKGLAAKHIEGPFSFLPFLVKSSLAFFQLVKTRTNAVLPSK